MDHGSYDEHQEYCEVSSSAEPSWLYELNRATHLRCIHPRMISGRLLGRTLSMISNLVRPDRILELGTFTGYSALCLAEGLSDYGVLTTIDKDDELIGIQEEFFAKSPYRDKIERRTGPALDILPGLEGPYQLIFIDADKENYMNYLPLVLNLCEIGSLILIDNMLWEGKVLDPAPEDKQTQVIVKLTESIKNNPRLKQVLLPVRDGLMVARVISD